MKVKYCRINIDINRLTSITFMPGVSYPDTRYVATNTQKTSLIINNSLAVISASSIKIPSNNFQQGERVIKLSHPPTPSDIC